VLLAGVFTPNPRGDRLKRLGGHENLRGLEMRALSPFLFRKLL